MILATGAPFAHAQWIVHDPAAQVTRLKMDVTSAKQLIEDYKRLEQLRQMYGSANGMREQIASAFVQSFDAAARATSPTVYGKNVPPLGTLPLSVWRGGGSGPAAQRYAAMAQQLAQNRSYNDGAAAESDARMARLRSLIATVAQTSDQKSIADATALIGVERARLQAQQLDFHAVQARQRDAEREQSLAAHEAVQRAGAEPLTSAGFSLRRRP